MGMLEKAQTAAPTDSGQEQTAPDTGDDSTTNAPEAEQTPDNTDQSQDQGAEGENSDKPDPNVRIATPEEQKQYMAALEMLYKIMYVNDGSAMALVNHIDPKDKIGSIIKAVMVMIHQMDTKMKMMPAVLAQITQDATDRMVEIAERIKKLTYTKQETLVMLAAAQDAVEKATGTVSGDSPTAPVVGDQPAQPEAAPASAPSESAAPTPTEAAQQPSEGAQ